MLRIALLAILIAACPATLQAQSYPIKLNRPTVVGQKFRETIQFERFQRNLRSSDGVQLENRTTTFKLDFAGLVTVTGVNKKGDTTGLTIVIERFKKNQGQFSYALVPKGTLIVGTLRGDNVIWSSPGKADLTKETRDALNELLELEEDSDDEKMFGSKKPRSIGESWPVNAQAVIDDLKDQKIVVGGKQAVRGTVKLLKKSRIGSVDCLHLGIDLTINPLSLANMPKGFKMVIGKMSAKLSGALPLDIKLGPLQRKMSIDILMRLEGRHPKTNKLLRSEVQVKRKMVATRTYLP